MDPNYVEAYYFQGIAQLKKSMYSEGMEDLEKGVAIATTSEVTLTGLGYGYAVTGKGAPAHKVLD